jgi:hypothetical protein
MYPNTTLMDRNKGIGDRRGILEILAIILSA